MTAIRRPGAASAAVLFGLSASLVAAHAIAPEWSRRAEYGEGECRRAFARRADQPARAPGHE